MDSVLSFHQLSWALSQFCDASCGLNSWCYSLKDKHLFKAIGPNREELAAFFDISGCLDYAVEHADEFEDPVLLEDNLGMLWIADYSREDGTENTPKELLFVIGPFFNATASIQNIEQRLWEINLPIELRMPLLEKLKSVPILSIPNAQQYALMLHQALTGKKSSASCLNIQKKDNVPILDETGIVELPIHADRLRANERRILWGIQNGNLTEEDFEACIGAIGQDDYQTGSPLRQGKNTAIIFIALCSRAAVEGGLSPMIAKETEISFIRQAEQTTRILELRQLVRKMVMDYVWKVSLCRSDTAVSHTVQEVCYYVDNHLTEPLDLETLAKRVGYTEYYLTKKFKKETGVSLLDYIRKKRLELAKFYLQNGEKTMEDISAELHFGTRNYFTKVFKEAYGVSPTQYRQSCRTPKNEGADSQ